MKNILKILLTFLFLLAMVAHAGDKKRVGTGGAAYLLIPVGTRGIAMGEANISTAHGVEALFWNPAGVAKMDGSADVIFSHMSYIADIGVEYGAVAANFEGFGVVSLSLKSLSIGEIGITTIENPDGTGETFTPTSIVAGVSYSRQLTESIAIGLTGNFLSDRLGDVSASGFSVDVGVIYDNLASVNGLSIGFVVKNLGPNMQYTGSGLLNRGQIDDVTRPPNFYLLEAASFELPSNFQLAVGYQPVLDEINSLQFSGIYQNNNFSGDEYKVGGEYGYNNNFFVRAGYQFSPPAVEEYIYGFTAGVGVDYRVEGFGFKVDYAYREVEFFDGNHVFSLTLGC